MATTRKTRQSKAEPIDLKQSGSLMSTQTNPMIFVSHDSRDADLAESFSNLLRNVSMGVLKSFRSSDRKGSQGIEYGVEWYPDTMGKLHQASDVVCLLTERSIERPWILYEAGVAKGKFDTPVVGLALGIPLNKASTGPFAQFQNCQDDENSLTGLVTQLVCRIPNADPMEAVIRTQVKAFREEVKPILKKLGSKDKQAEDSPENITSVAKLFEEVKVMFQDLPTRIENRVDSNRKRKYGRFHPKMIHEFFFMAKEFGEPSLVLLVASSYFREEIPWLY